jgi:hypothetical protein
VILLLLLPPLLLIIIMLPVKPCNIAMGPAHHRRGRRREHSSIVLASVAVIPGMNKIVSSQPSSLSAGPCATPHIIRNKCCC